MICPKFCVDLMIENIIGKPTIRHITIKIMCTRYFGRLW